MTVMEVHTTIPPPPIRIGVLELQGDFAEHELMFQSINVATTGIRTLEDLEQPNIHALVIPGGESTTISKLLVEYKMMGRVQEMAKAGLPMFGTCAGCIMLCNDIVDYPLQPRISAIDISVKRNAYGAQVDSFECDVHSDVKAWMNGKPLHAIHIRAPRISRIGQGVQVLARFGDVPVLVQQGNVLVTSFHPEITHDTRIHEYFADIVREYTRKIKA
eukprot:CAMPEP_0184700502 /NCGR_PEP_ID=MMETSP0313-20130426/13859_1 /TAXON_ID=2792 /ORGANISM="Porphyridium aerugineum, Strain SAG 1380-2" /LENGTH=216 /DNA_ID=CAMNT_0027160205 /DNA_START=20 /DNA_END=670 /DNA_ORIENTATION=+